MSTRIDRSWLRSVLGYSVLMALAALISFTRQFVLAKLLAPETFGVFALVILGATYFSYFWTLGTHEALLKRTTTPSSNDDAGLLTGSVLVFTTTVFVAVSFVWFAVSGFLLRGSEFLVLVVTIPMYSYARSISALSMIEFRARRQHSRFAGVLAFRNLLSMAGATTGARVAPSVIAPAIGDAFAFSLVALGALRVSHGLGLRNVVERFRTGKNLAQLGFPYSLIAFLRNIGLNFDNWAVMIFRSTRELGLYSLTMLLLSLAGVLNNLIGTRLQPELLARIAEGEDRRALFRDLTRFAGKILLGMSAAIVPVTLLLRAAIDRFLPLYDAIGPELIGFTLLGIAFEVANVFEVAALPFEIAYRGTFVYATSAILVLLGCVFCGLLSAPLWSFALVFAGGRIANILGNFVVLRSQL